jgi:xanthine dehydrogenase small subunit
MMSLPTATIDEVALEQQLKEIVDSQAADYLMPKSLEQLLLARSQFPQAQVVAGCTDVGLWVTKQYRLFEKILDLTRVRELQSIEIDEQHITIGAAVTLQDAYAALIKERPQLQRFAERFAGLPVRQSGTLGGNVANGSPIGDSMPLLIALKASVVLASVKGSRTLPLQQLYTGYRKNVMAPDELLTHIQIPRPASHEQTRVYKISKRQDDDISAVCLALCLVVRDGRIASASIGAGGVAAVPSRAVQTEAFLVGQPWTQSSFEQAAAVLKNEFAPISDMRASAAYRREVLGNLLQRFWLDLDEQPIHLAALT